MTALTQPNPFPEPSSLRWKIVGDLVAALVLVTLAAATTPWLLEFETGYLINALGLYVAIAALLLVNIPRSLPGPGLGHANRITLVRASLIVPIAAIATTPITLNTAGAWWVISVSTIALILDGVDGYVSRLRQCGTTFGARFDMELDAFFLLVLSILVWQSGKTGAWITGIGIIRYAFVIAAFFGPWLGRTLPTNLRRKVICVIQGIALLICLGPIIPSTLASLVGSVALCSLVISFGVDIQWLAAHKETVRPTD